MEAERRDRRDGRIRREWAARELLWQVSSLERVRTCCRWSHTGGGPVLRMSEEGEQRVTGYAGLVRCGSVWACFGCSARINAEWAAEIETLLSAVLARHGGASLITLTARHHRGQALRLLWSGVQDAYGRMLKSRAWTRIAAQFGIQGQVRVLEVTCGESGWHPHLHLLILHDTLVSPELVQAMGEMIFDEYAKGLARNGLEAIEHRGGLNAQAVDLGDAASVAQYMNKVSRELTGEHTKTARGLENFTALELFEEFRTTGDMAFLDLWHEYEAASHGRKRITTSRGLFAKYGLGEARTDQEIVDEDTGGDDTIALPRETWLLLAGWLAAELRIVAERDGADGAASWLTARGLAWRWADTLRPAHAPRDSTIPYDNRFPLRL